MQQEKSHDEGLDLAATNRLAILRLGNVTTTTGLITGNDSEGPVIFTDPCSMCGTLKRRSSPLQEPIFEPRNKKILVEPTFTKDPTIAGGASFLCRSASFSSVNSGTPPATIPQLQLNPLVRSIYEPIPTLTPPSPIKPSVPTTSPVSSLLAYVCRCGSENNTTNNVNSLGPPSPASFVPSDSLSSPKSPDNVESRPTPPPQRVAYLGRLNSFSCSSDTTPTSAEASPATASLPPRPPSLCRSLSTPIRYVTPMAPLKGDETPKPTTSGQTVSGVTFPMTTDSTSSEKRWKRMRERLAEMNNWFNNVIQEQEKEDENPNENNDNNRKDVPETVADGNVTAERDGDSVKVRCNCSCGNRYQIVCSI